MGYRPRRSVGVMSACRVIERMPTRVSWILSSLKPPKRRVVAAKAGIAVVAIVANVWCGSVEAMSGNSYRR